MSYQRRAEPVWPAFPTVPVPIARADPRRVSLIAFLQRIPTETRVAIRSAAKEDALLEDYLAMLDATPVIELDHPDTLAGVTYLRSLDLLTEQEAEALLA